jgi:hypothetical protein
VNVQFQAKQLQDVNDSSDLQSWLAPLEFGEEPHADPSHSGGILQRQTRLFAALPHQVANFRGTGDSGHVHLPRMNPAREKCSHLRPETASVFPIGKK